MKICVRCDSSFAVSDQEKSFFQKIAQQISASFPEPVECPSCRMQRRFSWRNEMKLYKRTSDLTGKQIVSVYRPDSPYTVYEQHEWYSDKWNALDYGRNFDFNRPFFEQFDELMKEVPKLSLFASKNENSDYCNGAQQNKNCYMIFVSDHNEDCYYSYSIFHCKDSIECLVCHSCENCIECIDCSQSYHLSFCQNSHNCSDSYFLHDCKNCRACFGCYGLRGKEYCIFNEQLTKEAYENRISELNTGHYDTLEHIKKIVYNKIQNQQIHQYYDGNNNQNSTGDHILNCKNCIECYDSSDLEDCGYLIYSTNVKDCYDCHVAVDGCELIYECVSNINQYNCQFTFCSYYSKNGMYLDHCISTNNCFACSGLKNAQYCIFNKQYHEDEYHALRKKIMEHSQLHALPGALSPFSYYETVAHEYFPLVSGAAKAAGWKWDKEEEKQEMRSDQNRKLIPKAIRDVDQDIASQVYICEQTGRPFKFMLQEIQLYKTHNLPLPRTCFEQRHLERIQKRNPRKLWKRECGKCGKGLQTTYAPERTEIIYCESCYLQEVY